MVAEFSLDDSPSVGDTPPSDRPKRRGRRTKAELEAAGIQPKSGTRTSRVERWTRYAEIFSTVYSLNAFVSGTGAAKYALQYYDREELARVNNVEVSRVPPSELERLCLSFDAYQAAEPKLHRYVELMLARSPGVTFAIVCISIALPRLEMMGLLPWMKKPQQLEEEEEQYEPSTVNTNGTTPASVGPIGAPDYNG
jgi:hypothetical protein